MRKQSDASGKLSSEFKLIARLSAGIHLSRRTILGVGDDCAIVSRPRGDTLFTIDSLVENVHFDLRWCPPRLLGARALAVNLSDIAAMGGRATACVVNLGVREGITSRTLERIYSGLRDAAREASTDIVGGNVTRARELSDDERAERRSNEPQPAMMREALRDRVAEHQRDRPGISGFRGDYHGLV